MENDRPEFQPDPYFEKLLRLRERDPAQYYAYPDDVKELLARYEAEREAAGREPTE